MGSTSRGIGSDRSSQPSRMKRLLSSLLLHCGRTSNSNSPHSHALEHRLVSIQQNERAKMKINLIVDEVKQLSTDIISTLPQSIIESILSLLPIHEAAMTSILSREWRYKWTTISTLDFSHFELHVANSETNECTYFDYIFQVLESYQGHIHELVLEICDDCGPLGLYILMLYLAKKHTVKKLELYGWYPGPRPVPDLHRFSLHHLTDLHLAYVRLEDETMFNINIGSITSLVLDNVLIYTQSLLCLLSNCPSLKSLYLHIYDIGSENCSIMELFKCLPMIERLTIESEGCLYSLDIGLVPQKFSSVLFHLKYFCLGKMLFDGDSCLPFVLDLIKCAPNLEKIKLEIVVYDDDDDEEYSVKWGKYSHVWLENLIELEIKDLSNLKVEMEFVKFILARSPKLKKLNIKVREYGDYEKEKSKMLEALLQAPHASSVRIIYV